MSGIPTSSILSNVYSPSSIRSLAVWYDMFDTEYVRFNISSTSTLIDKSGFRNNASSIVSGAGTTGIPYLANEAGNKGGCIFFNGTINQSVQIPDKTRQNWSWFVLMNGPALYTPSGTFATRWYGGRGILDGTIHTNNSNNCGMSLLSTALACGTGYSTITQTTIYVSSLTSIPDQYLNDATQKFYICEFLRDNDTGYMESYINGGGFASGIGDIGTRTLLTAGLRLGGLANSNNATLTNARFYEILMYSTFLSKEDRQQVEGYLAWKWGFPNQLSIDHPYRSNPFIITPQATPTSIPNNTFLIPVNTYSSIKTFLFPTVNTNPGRMIVVKDNLGYANRNPIYISTQGTDTFEGLYPVPTDYGILSTSYGAWTFQNDGISKWFITSEYTNSMLIQPTDPTIYPHNPIILLDPATSTIIPDPVIPANISSFPTNMGTFLNFSSEGQQFIDFGQKTYDFSQTGFALKTKIMFTQVRNPPAATTILNFTNGQDTNCMFIRANGFSNNSISVFDFTYTSSTRTWLNNTNNYRGTSIRNLFYTSNIYNITVNYTPIPGAYGNRPYGAVAFWVDGTCVYSNSASITSGPFTMGPNTYSNVYIGRPNVDLGGYLPARIYKLGVYNRYLTDDECAYLW